MKTLIAIPCGDFLDVRFVDSLIHLKTVPETGIRMHAGSLVYDARNQLAQFAVENNFDFMLWLDSDMSFEPDFMERMFESLGNKDFLTGLYFTRRQPFRPTVFSKNHLEAVEGGYSIAWEYVPNIPDEIFEIEGCGFGAVLFRVSMLREIMKKSALPFTPVYGLGEDLSFCMRAREEGYKLWCDPSIILGHTAQIVVGSEEIKNSWNESHK